MKPSELVEGQHIEVKFSNGITFDFGVEYTHLDLAITLEGGTPEDCICIRYSGCKKRADDFYAQLVNGKQAHAWKFVDRNLFPASSEYLAVE